MGAILHSLNYHWICSTKEQRPLISAPWRPALLEFLLGAIRDLEAKPLNAGGAEDHVHALFTLKTTHCIADFVRDLKKNSAAWALANLDREFAWQDGYSIFTVSTSMLNTVGTYIDRHDQVHKRRAFEAELKQLLVKHGVGYDPKYLL